MTDQHTHHRPPWWPDDEPWPPAAAPWRHGPPGMRRRHRRAMHRQHEPWAGYRRGFGCLIVLFATLVVAIGVLVLWVIGGLFGLGSAEGPLAILARPASLVVLVVGVIALAMSVRVARRVGRPLSDLVEAAGRIEAADYSARVTETPAGGSDLRGLSHAFNAMAARLEAEDATRRRLLADVSHELRTPLAVIQGNLEAILDGVYPADADHLGPILDETRVLERLIDDLRTLSLAESGALPLHPELTDPAVLLEDVASAHRARAAAAGVDIAVAAPAALGPLEIDPVRIRQVVGNLVDNALRVLPSGGTITLAAAPAVGPISANGEGPADAVALTVQDDGPGIPADLLPHVFERFVKSTSSRGSGLGLAIARAIVEAHGGTITATSVEAPADAHGTTITVQLPA